MKENALRKIHRHIGIIIALFLFLQGGSGLLMALGQLFTPHYAHSDTTHDHHVGFPVDDTTSQKIKNQSANERHGIIGQIHHKEGTVWHLYRVLVGTGLLVMVFSGVTIFIKIQKRSKNT